MNKNLLKILIVLTGTLGSATAQVVTTADTIGICAGTTGQVNVLLNDIGDELSLTTILIEPSFGTTSFEPDGVITLDYIAGEYEPVDALIYVTVDSAGNSGIGTLTILIGEGDECVWPGDANDDNVANHVDLLSIGLFYGDTGPSRYSDSTNWEAQYSIDWEYPSFLSLNDRKYADCNGDGIIDEADILPILDNYGQIHARTTDIEGGDGFPPLGFTFFSDTVYAGAEVSIPVYLGSADFPATNIYGLAFTIEYSSDLIVPGTMSVTFNTGWLAETEDELISLNRDDDGNGLFDVAVSRINNTSITGYGHIGEVSFVMEDNLAGKITDLTAVLNLCPVSPTITNALGNLVLADGIDLICDSVVVLQLSAGMNDWSETWNLYPNPVTHEFTITTIDTENYTYRIFNALGQPVISGSFWGNQSTIIFEQPTGTYLLEISKEDGTTYSNPFIKL